MTDEAAVSTVSKVLILQSLVLAIMTCGFFIHGGWVNAKSPCLGGLTALLPNILFAYWIQLTRGKSAKNMVRSLYFAEAKKIFLTVALFILVVQVPGVKLLTLLVGYSVVLSVHWFALILWRDF